MSYNPTPKQEQAIRDWVQEAIVPLIEQVLVKKLGQAMSFAAQEVIPPPRKPWVGLTDEMVVAAARMLSDRQAAACNVDCGDMWKIHGNDFIEDARAALEAAHGIKGDA